MSKIEVRLFTLLVLFFALASLAYVRLVHLQNQDELLRTLERNAAQAEQLYQGLFESTLIDMQQIVTLIANNDRVKSAFWNGRVAVENEGGGPGGVQAEFFREVLLATVAAERIRSAVETKLRLSSAPELSVTCSIGVGQLKTDDTSETLIKRTDEALYRAKAAGRNRVLRADT